ncbi:hypothetical protein [Brevundimonas sp.]|uniref:hypothetical protein n=1 Tax=Brevundimonas sp. TaxID=1871086 RepID=UPI002ED8B3EF
MVDQSAHLDPRKLREFGDDLQSTVNFYKDVLGRLEGGVSRLGNSWRDQQYAEFVQEVKTLRQGLAVYIAEAEAARKHLIRLSDGGEDILKVQIR